MRSNAPCVSHQATHYRILRMSPSRYLTSYANCYYTSEFCRCLSFYILEKCTLRRSLSGIHIYGALSSRYRAEMCIRASLQTLNRALTHTRVRFLCLTPLIRTHVLDHAPLLTRFATITHRFRGPNVLTLMLRRHACAPSSFWPYTRPHHTATSFSSRERDPWPRGTNDRRP
jgi:hypothetical protein